MTSYPSDYNGDRHSRFLLDIIDGRDPFERDPTFFDAKDPLGKAHAIAESQARRRSMEQSTKTPLSATPRELSRSPPPAGMLRILKWRAESEKPSTAGYTTRRDSVMPKTAKDAKEPRPQRTMAEIEAVLHPKVKNLERTRLVFQDALNDCRMCVWLPKDPADLHSHILAVVNSLHPAKHFKVGITCNPKQRFHTSWYAYSLESVAKRQGIRFEQMIIAHAHHVRDVITTTEHFCIKLMKNAYPARCGNVREKQDNHIEFDASDEEKPDAAGPHVLYLVFGDRY